MWETQTGQAQWQRHQGHSDLLQQPALLGWERAVPMPHRLLWFKTCHHLPNINVCFSIKGVRMLGIGWLHLFVAPLIHILQTWHAGPLLHYFYRLARWWKPLTLAWGPRFGVLLMPFAMNCNQFMTRDGWWWPLVNYLPSEIMIPLWHGYSHTYDWPTTIIKKKHHTTIMIAYYGCFCLFTDH